ncbi:aldolase/citrate lyase family protein [Nocardioides sp. L-11A]|uniref:aldolase/citrate lyase family protein n=1 Tax=Nocardioides sp. L-11A TaxID=3043848 RepID=UPI00249CC962|nr:aldolase/citrate lyase family protein [Nocardioides sp. L-11A]
MARTPRSRQLGLLTSSVDPVLIDSVAQAGLDFLWLDAENTGLTPVQVGEVVGRLSGSATRTAVRVQNQEPDMLLTYANMGVDEIVVPRVRTLREIQQACAWLSYPPAGRRPRQVTPGTAWGTSYEREPAVSIIVETMDVVRSLEQIAAAQCVTTFWLGPKDLRDDYEQEGGGPGGFDEVLHEVITTLAGLGVEFGWGVPDPSDVASVWRSGATCCALYWDVHLARHLSRSARTVLTADPLPSPVPLPDGGLAGGA